MVIPLVDDATKELEDISSIKEIATWFEGEIERLEPNAGGTPIRFRRQESGELVGWIETEAQPEWKPVVENYYAYPVTPTNSIVLIHDNDAAIGIPSIGGTAILNNDIEVGYVRIGDKTVFHNNAVVGSGVAIDWQTPFRGFRVLARIEKPKFLPSALELRLEHIGQLTTGWDSYGALQISHTSVERAKAVITQVLSDKIGLPAPFVAPTSPGGIGFEWKLESGKELLLEISPTGDMSYLLVEPRLDGGEDEVEDCISDPEELKKLLLALSK